MSVGRLGRLVEGRVQARLHLGGGGFAGMLLRLDALIADAPDRGKASSVYWGRWLSLNEAKRVRTLLVARLRELGLLPQ
jgi:hypothetical protein